MNRIVILATLIVAATANPILLNRAFVPITSLRQEIGPNGVYSVHAESADGTFAETGALVLPAGAKEHGATKNGQFSYTSPEGQVISLQYVADENGYRPTGAHLPVPPPMPEEIRAMLPTLPKLVEVEEPHFVRAAPLHVARPVHLVQSAPVQRVLVSEAPEKMFVQTPEFLIDSSSAKTLVRIGN